MPRYWASFNLAPKRIQNGGWARQVTQDDFTISTTIAAVRRIEECRLVVGKVRVLRPQFALKTVRAQATSPANRPPAVTAIRSLIFSISSSSDETHTTAAPASPDAMVPAGNAWLALS
jgi:hypothetical protein